MDELTVMAEVSRDLSELCKTNGISVRFGHSQSGLVVVAWKQTSIWVEPQKVDQAVNAFTMLADIERGAEKIRKELCDLEEQF